MKTINKDKGALDMKTFYLLFFGLFLSFYLILIITMFFSNITKKKRRSDEDITQKFVEELFPRDSREKFNS